MEFNIIYQKYNKIIHYLLTRYQITYNYDEFYQLLLIQMWHLSNNYNPSKSNKFSSYLFIRLNYYLIDIFRKESNKIKTSDIDDYISSEIEPSQHINNESLLIQDIHYLLNSKEKEWLLLKLSGYKQYEIAERMHLSLTTIKKIKKSVQSKITKHLHYTLKKE
ncbi:sigma-70 family RNA polymerase sigma factor [Staphylococcus pasteuri]|uniref:sigma-70 family RNA polymerase sigma factor n=1 Tax=Staphylococcus pasteuri TaxID=45972 RepID=UPI001E56236B|nr:sigma-70 family RNA polymerase sigma factor [Staphylococcus pasteuri]MCE3021872.1 sigma-70 family RNA polymerase sigma factor [Staphylococcus pasteuri]